MTAPLSPSLERNPDLDTWVRVDPAETVTVFTGKAELGQGIRSAIAWIAAEELDLALNRILVQTADTAEGPDEQITAGSQSVAESGGAMRYAAAQARAHLLALAAEELGADPSELRVDDGTILAPDGTSTTYWALMGGRRFGARISGLVSPKSADEYRLVGRPGPRVDLLGIVTGTTRYVHDLQPPGLLHARVLRPPSPGAQLTELDEAPATAVGEVTVVSDGGFVGVVAEREEHAVMALEALRARARWTDGEKLPTGRSVEWLTTQPRESFMVVDGAALDGPIEEWSIPDAAELTIERTFTRPFQMHATIGPSAALAEWRDGLLTVWSHSQSVHLLKPALAEALDLQPDEIRVVHVPGAGCYGHNGADDAAFDAALLARAVPERPILVKWSREDEHRWEPYAPPAVVEAKASLDAKGRIVSWSLEAWGTTHNSRAFPYGPRSALLGAWHREQAKPRQPATPLRVKEAGIHRNATPLYSVPEKRIVKHFVPWQVVRTSSIRSLGAYANVFAIESLMDELAWAAGSGPLEFRLAHLDDSRARDVLEAAAERVDWPNRPREAGRGFGIGLARYKNLAAYAAVVANVRIDDDTAQIVVDHVVIASDVGQAVDPDGVANQLEGGVVQAVSWTLKEEVTFDGAEVTSVDWDSYPILNFSEAPTVDVVLIERPGAPYLGCGEAAQGPTAAAIANGVYEAVGLRLRDIPFTPERVRHAAATEDAPERALAN